MTYSAFILWMNFSSGLFNVTTSYSTTTGLLVVWYLQKRATWRSKKIIIIKAENLQHEGIEDSFPHVNIVTWREKNGEKRFRLFCSLCAYHMLIIRNGNRETIKVQNYLYVWQGFCIVSFSSLQPLWTVWWTHRTAPSSTYTSTIHTIE